jgi:lysophospholipase L1-like esterase
MTRPDPSFGLRKSLAYASVLFLATVLLLDWTASYLAPPAPVPTRRPQERYFEFDPLLMWRLRPGFREGSIAISPEGFRASANEASGRPQAAAGRKLVFLLGGSTVFGLGVPGEQTVSAFLQELLGDEYHVVNAGVTGYASTQELILTHRRLLDFGPHRVLALTGRNDVFYALHPAYRPDEVPYHGLIREQVGALDPYASPGDPREPRFHLFRLLARALRPVAIRWDREWSAAGLRADPRATGVFLRNERALHALLAGLGVRYDLFLQPTINHPPRRLAPQEAAGAPAYLAPLNEGYRPLVDAATERLGGDWCHGIVALPDSEEPLFLDDAHFTETGARAAARALYRAAFSEISTARIDFASGPRGALLVSGWHDHERDFRWTRRRARALLRVPDAGGRFSLSGTVGDVDERVTVSLEGRELLAREVRARDEVSLEAPVPAALCGRAVEVEVSVSRPWVPKDLGINPDPRELGIRVRSLGFLAAATGASGVRGIERRSPR